MIRVYILGQENFTINLSFCPFICYAMPMLLSHHCIIVNGFILEFNFEMYFRRDCIAGTDNQQMINGGILVIHAEI